jgi:hypothetical protein
VALSREALDRARRLVGAQAEMLAEQMSSGSLPPLDGPDALRLLAMILAQEPAPSEAARGRGRQG